MFYTRYRLPKTVLEGDFEPSLCDVVNFPSTKEMIERFLSGTRDINLEYYNPRDVDYDFQSDEELTSEVLEDYYDPTKERGYDFADAHADLEAFRKNVEEHRKNIAVAEAKKAAAVDSVSDSPPHEPVLSELPGADLPEGEQNGIR